jgi:hypothetical protein
VLFFIVRDELQISDENFVKSGGKKFDFRKSGKRLFIESVLKVFKLYR